MKRERAQEPRLGGPATMTLLRAIAAQHDVGVDDIRGPSRRRHVSRARHEAMAALRDRGDLSLTTIGAILGGRDHSSVIKGAAAHAKRTAEAAQ